MGHAVPRHLRFLFPQPVALPAGKEPLPHVYTGCSERSIAQETRICHCRQGSQSVFCSLPGQMRDCFFSPVAFPRSPASHAYTGLDSRSRPAMHDHSSPERTRHPRGFPAVRPGSARPGGCNRPLARRPCFFQNKGPDLSGILKHGLSTGWNPGA